MLMRLLSLPCALALKTEVLKVQGPRHLLFTICAEEDGLVKRHVRSAAQAEMG